MEFPSGERDDEAFDLELRQNGGKFRGGEAGVCAEGFDAGDATGDGVQDKLFLFGNGRCCGRGCRASGVEEFGLESVVVPAEVVEYLRGAGDEGSSVPDEFVTTFGRGAVDGAGNGVDQPSLLHGLPGGNEGAASERGFDDKGGF